MKEFFKSIEQPHHNHPHQLQWFFAQAWCTLHIVSYLKKPNSSNCWCCKHLGQESCNASNINFQKWNWAFKKSYWIRFTWPLLPKARTTIEAETTSRSAVKTINQSHFFVKTLTNLELTLEMQTKYYFILISKRSPGRKCQKIKFSQEGEGCIVFCKMVSARLALWH